jgi:hypothetical protein
MYKVAQDFKIPKLSYGRPYELYPVSLKEEGKEKSDLSFSKSLTGIETSDARLGGLCPLHVPQHLKPLSGITIGQSISHLQRIQQQRTLPKCHRVRRHSILEAVPIADRVKLEVHR